jgi:HD-like signal output (HDOD) protein
MKKWGVCVGARAERRGGALLRALCAAQRATRNAQRAQKQQRKAEQQKKNSRRVELNLGIGGHKEAGLLPAWHWHAPAPLTS